jgi:hypothetical protein
VFQLWAFDDFRDQRPLEITCCGCFHSRGDARSGKHRRGDFD